MMKCVLKRSAVVFLWRCIRAVVAHVIRMPTALPRGAGVNEVLIIVGKYLLAFVSTRGAQALKQLASFSGNDRVKTTLTVQGIC